MSRSAVAPLAGSIALVIALVACGSADDGSAVTGPDESTVGSVGGVGGVDTVVPEMTLVPASTVPAPPVSLPDSIPTELVVTEITPGTGEPAVDGDTLFVNYVGVRTEDGTQFDSNFGGEPIVVTLGSGGVIPGWEQGLVGTTQGERLQLDIPSDLAYGDEDRGDVIKAGDALSFVIDVVAIVPPIAVEAPTAEELPRSPDLATETEVVDLREGDGATLEAGQTGVFHLIAARADDGTTLQTTWDTDPIAIRVEEGELVDEVLEGLPGMKVGGRRLVRVLSTETDGLDPPTDIYIVADLLAVF